MNRATFNHVFLCDSPLLHPAGWLLLGAIAAGVAVLAIPTWIGWLSSVESARVLAFAFGMALLGSILTILLVRFLDRRDPTPARIQVLVFALALLVAPAAAAHFNERSPFETLTVGLNEEFWKMFPLLFVVLFLPRWVLTIRDGLLFGAVGGLGFNLLETAVYVLRSSYPEHGLLEGTTFQLSRLGFWGVGNHVIWAALVGAGIGFFVQSRSSRWRNVVPILIYVLAALTHTAQDNGVSIILMILAAQVVLPIFGLDPSATGTGSKDAFTTYLPQLMAAEEVMINLINLPVLFWALMRSGRWERDAIRAQLASESPDIVTPSERVELQGEGRFRQRTAMGHPKRVARRLRSAQNGLAFQKQHLVDRGRDVEADDIVSYFRSEVICLRKQLDCTTSPGSLAAE